MCLFQLIISKSIHQNSDFLTVNEGSNNNCHQLAFDHFASRAGSLFELCCGEEIVYCIPLCTEFSEALRIAVLVSPSRPVAASYLQRSFEESADSLGPPLPPATIEETYHQNLELLGDIGEEEEELHAGEAFTQTDSLSSRERDQFFAFLEMSFVVEVTLGLELLWLGKDLKGLSCWNLPTLGSRRTEET